MTNVAAVDVDEIMDRQESITTMEKLQAAFEANPAAMKMLEAVESAEDAYNVVKQFVSIKLDEFKVLFDKTVNYFKGPKVHLEDEMLECVAGGGFFGDFWNKYKKQIVMGAIIVASCAVGITVGALCGGIEGALMGGCAGALVGTALGATAAHYMD